MKILNARVDWMKDWDNHPNLVVLVDKMPKAEDLSFNQHGGMYWSIKDGYASYLYYTQPGDGFAGRVFTLKMVDGTTKELKGPWSSRAGCVNTVLHGLPGNNQGPIVDVTMTDDPDVYSGKVIKCFFAAAITMDLAKQAAKMARCNLVMERNGEDITYTPSMDKKYIIKPRNRQKSKPTYKRFVYGYSEEFKTLKAAQNTLPTKVLCACRKDPKNGSVSCLHTFQHTSTAPLSFLLNNGMVVSESEAATLAYAFGQIPERKEKLVRTDISKF